MLCPRDPLAAAQKGADGSLKNEMKKGCPIRKNWAALHFASLCIELKRHDYSKLLPW